MYTVDENVGFILADFEFFLKGRYFVYECTYSVLLFVINISTRTMNHDAFRFTHWHLL